MQRAQAELRRLRDQPFVSVGPGVITRIAVPALCALLLLVGCRRPPAATRPVATTAPATATQVLPRLSDTMPAFKPSVQPTVLVSSSGAYTVTLPPPWTALPQPTGSVSIELKAVRPSPSGEPLAALAIQTAPATGITLDQQMDAAARELAAQENARVERHSMDYSYRLISKPLGILDYTVVYPGRQPDLAGRQYAMYMVQPPRFILLTFTGKPADLAALRQELEVITASVKTAE